MVYFSDSIRTVRFDKTPSFEYQNLGENFDELKSVSSNLTFALTFEMCKSYFSEVLQQDLTEEESKEIFLEPGDTLYVCHPKTKDQKTTILDLNKHHTEVSEILDQNRSHLNFDLFKIAA